MSTIGKSPNALIVPAPITNPGRPWIRTTYQLAAKISATPETVDAKLKDVCKTVIYWVKDRFPDRLPQPAWEGESFRLELPGQKVEAISIPEIGCWSFRLEHPDMPFDNRPAVPGRTWTTDIGLIRAGSDIHVGIRSYCASLPYASVDGIAMTRPRVVLEFAQRHGMKDERTLSRQPWLLSSEDDVARLFDLITSKERKLPVVVLTQPDRSRLHLPVSDYVLHPVDLANRCCGLAHVVQLPWELGYKWTELVGKPWSVYLGAVRTYQPGIDLDNDHPSQHPSTFAEKILAWKLPDGNRFGEAPFTDFLVQRLYEAGAFRRVDWGSVCFLPETRTKNAEVIRTRTAESGDWKQLYESEITALNEKISELTKEAEEWADDAQRTAQERDQYKDSNRQLRFQVDSLRLALSEKTGGRSESEIPIPDNYDDLTDWVSRHLTGRLELHSRAQRGLKNANYEEIGVVYKALLLLANQYRNQCLGRDGAQDEFSRLLGELGLRLDKSISQERAGEQGDEYFVRYPTSFSPKRFLEWHLRKGSNKDTRYCLGIYFFWDDDTKQVIVGWLPSHLDNRMT
jgi:hypothetical protein